MIEDRFLVRRLNVDVRDASSVEAITSPAARALKQAMAWQAMIDAEGITQAEIVRREGVTRNRVSFYRRLLKLPDTVRSGLLRNEPVYDGWSVRKAMMCLARSA